MRQTLVLDAAGWHNIDDFYDDFFRAVRAPDWHGRNFNALRDSIAHGQINEIEVPYLIVVRNTSNLGSEAKQILGDFRDLINGMATEGCDVAIQVEE